MKIFYKNQNSGAMTRVGFLAMICGALLVLALVLHFRTARGSVSKASSRVVSKETESDSKVIQEFRRDAPNLNVEVIEIKKFDVLVVTNTMSVTNDINFSTTERRGSPARKQRVQIPPGTRLQLTNVSVNKPTGPGVPIAFP